MYRITSADRNNNKVTLAQQMQRLELQQITTISHEKQCINGRYDRMFAYTDVYNRQPQAVHAG